MKSQNELIYIGDPMCSWCYGFSPELDKIKEAFPNIPFQIIMGGLRPDGRETIGELKQFLTSHWKEVQEKSGQKFNFAIFNQEDIYYNTEPACRSVIIVRTLKPNAAYDYFKAVQSSFYLANNHPADEEVYADIAQKFGIDKKTFLKEYNRHELKEAAYADFAKAESMGVKGFPSLVAKIDGKYYLVCSGYEKADRLILRLQDKGL